MKRRQNFLLGYSLLKLEYSLSLIFILQVLSKTPPLINLKITFYRFRSSFNPYVRIFEFNINKDRDIFDMFEKLLIAQIIIFIIVDSKIVPNLFLQT